MTNPYDPPESRVADQDTPRYVGFWARMAATVLDAIILLAVTLPPLYLIYGSEYFLGDQFFYGTWDLVFNYVIPAVGILLFWRFKSATPGKMAIGARIVDASSGGRPSTGQFVGRYLGYFPALLIFGLGYIWIAFDPKKQGWHDKLARTVVVSRKTSVA